MRRPPGNGSPVLQWGWGLLHRGRQACACTGGSTETGGRAEGAQLPLKGVPPAFEVAPHASSVLDALVKGWLLTNENVWAHAGSHTGAPGVADPWLNESSSADLQMVADGSQRHRTK